MKSTLAPVGLALALALALGAAADAAAAAHDDGHQFASFAGFNLNTTALSEVVARLGPATKVESGEAGEFVASVCYRTRYQYVTFLTGELEGAKYLLGFTLARNADRPPCAAWPRGINEPDPHIANLRLGMSRQQFEHALGAPVEWKDAHATRTFASTRRLSRAEMGRLSNQERQSLGTEPTFDVIVTIDADFDEHQLSALTVYRTETN